MTPKFYGLSLTDQWKPNDRLNVNVGLRLDQYGYTGADTSGSPARAFWFNAWNNDTCYDTQTLTLYDKTDLAGGKIIPITSSLRERRLAVRAGDAHEHAEPAFTYDIWQPRLGATYTVIPDTVLRAS